MLSTIDEILKEKIVALDKAFLQSNTIDTKYLELLRCEATEAGFHELIGFTYFIETKYFVNGHNFEGYKRILAQLKARPYHRYTALYCRILEAYFYYYGDINLDKALANIQKAVAHLGKISDPDRITQMIVSFLAGVVYMSLGRFKEAGKYCRDALYITLDETDEYLLISIHKLLIGIKLSCQKFATAIRHINTCKSLYQKYPLDYDYGQFLSMVGLAYASLGRMPLAITHLTESIELAKKFNDHTTLSNAYNNLGTIYFNQKDYDLAETHLLNSLKYTDKCSLTLPTTLSNLGSLCTKKGDYHKALDYLFQTISLLKESQPEDIYLITKSHIAIAAAYYFLKNAKKTIKHLKHAEKLNQKLENNTIQTLIYKQYIALYKELEQYKKALHYCELERELYEQMQEERVKSIIKAYNNP